LLLFRFDVINGLLIPGGGATLKPGHPFYDAAHLLLRLAIQANDKGDYFPVRPSHGDLAIFQVTLGHTRSH